jgi:hypothetical protein
VCAEPPARVTHCDFFSVLPGEANTITLRVAATMYYPKVSNSCTYDFCRFPDSFVRFKRNKYSWEGIETLRSGLQCRTGTLETSDPIRKAERLSTYSGYCRRFMRYVFLHWFNTRRYGVSMNFLKFLVIFFCIHGIAVTADAIRIKMFRNTFFCGKSYTPVFL